MLRFIICGSVLLLSACGFEQSHLPSEPPPSGSTCEPEIDVIEREIGWLPLFEGGEVLNSIAVHGAYVDGPTPSLLVSQETRDGRDLSILELDGTSTLLATTERATVYPIVATPIELPDGRRCAAWYISGSLWFGCDDGTLGDTGYTVSEPLLPVVYDRGDVSLFTRRNEVYTELFLEVGARWRELEKWHRPGSTPFSARNVDGQPIVCFRGNAGLTIEHGESTARAEVAASRCHLTSTSAGVHVVSDAGEGFVPWSDDARGGFELTEAFSFVSALELTPRPALADVLELVTLDDRPYELTVHGGWIHARELSNDGPITIDELPPGSTLEALRLIGGGDRVLVVSSTLDSESGFATSQRIRVASYCTDTFTP